ncbi:MAG: hypothetical protein EZS28_029435 [Streblomastix strix]|uniref:Uncharacterized protein n=1 Tax=Streblomastix strix TaxID=222440 RepID=A0A5J4UWG0_9EUKA|nr:MAG: hypothetical protein EZS28_029435 [Streblomastix strix]
MQIPNLLHSLIKLCNYKQNTHIIKKEDEQSEHIRKNSRLCLSNIWNHGDQSTFIELATVGYALALIISLSTAGGIGDQEDCNICYGFNNIIEFLRQLHLGRQYYTNFPPQPALCKVCEEQIEEEGGIDEVDAQTINKGEGLYQWNTKHWANKAIGEYLNYFKYS